MSVSIVCAEADFPTSFDSYDGSNSPSHDVILNLPNALPTHRERRSMVSDRHEQAPLLSLTLFWFGARLRTHPLFSSDPTFRHMLP